MNGNGSGLRLWNCLLDRTSWRHGDVPPPDADEELLEAGTCATVWTRAVACLELSAARTDSVPVVQSVSRDNQTEFLEPGQSRAGYHFTSDNPGICGKLRVSLVATRYPVAIAVAAISKS
jgi:hypothetical protein